MIVVSLAGCATLMEMKGKIETRDYFVTARELLDRGDYEGALKENQKVLSLYGKVPPGDEALFNTGLIYAHHGYSKRDYGKSLDHFKKLVKVFPKSSLAGQAKNWIAILQEHEKLEESNKSMRKLQQENERLNKEIEELKMTIKKSKQVDIEIEGKKKELLK